MFRNGPLLSRFFSRTTTDMKVSYLVDTDWIIDQRMIGDFDLLIASTCLCHDLTLLTNNVGHFERIEGLRLLSISK